jgi:hypothetical protein
MLDSFLEVAYEVETKKSAEFELVGLLKGIPTMELRKLASGTPIAELYAKTAFLDDCHKSSSDGGPTTFLDKFKDTPLFEQALALEQESLQAEAADIAKRVEENSQPRPWEVMDQIRLKKRLLELELAKQTAGAQVAPPDEVAQGAGAPGPVPEAAVQDSGNGLGGGVAKVGEAEKRAAALVQFSDSFARALARSDFEKAARADALTKTGSAVGALMAKTALPNLGALSGMASKVIGAAKPIASKALGMAASHPELAGAAVGAAGGALAGGPDHRLSGALGGAAVGAGAGHAAGGIAQGMKGGQGFTDAAKSYGSSVLQKAENLHAQARGGGALSNTASARGAAFKPGLNNVQSMPPVTGA